MNLPNLLNDAFQDEAALSDKLRRLFETSGGKSSIPSRQKISDILAGRRELPRSAATVLQQLTVRAKVRSALKEAWDRFGASVLWSMSKEFALDPENLEAVAEELRYGNLEAFRASADLKKIKSETEKMEMR